MQYTYKIITEKSELFAYKDQILELFNIAFGKAINDKIWDWFYLHNPYGNPIASLCFYNNKLAGHYAVVPRDFHVNKIIYKFLLSMTTMVHPNHQGKGLFTTQAQQVYDAGASLNYKGVYGFPNQNSIYGFKNKLNWICQTDYVASLDKIEVMKYFSKNSNDGLQLILSDTNLQYFLSKPEMNYRLINKQTIIKPFADGFDLMHLSYPEDLKEFEQKFNLLIDGGNIDYLNTKLFDYHFGYKFFDETTLDILFSKELILSDVF